MSQASVPIETARGYSTPSVRQFSVFLDNKVGKLHELVEAFDLAANCQICAISVHEASDHAVVRIVPNCSKTAKEILRTRRLAFSELDLLVVEFGADHSLPGLCLSLLAAELNISFAYPVLLRSNGKPTIAICVDDNVLAGQILRKKGFRLLGEADLPRPGSGQT
ncbi:MAG: hypothetical protein KF684_02405 [Phycisphaeraceae bacterium]|nr:hypothetical protein [Phycisphaeraceae bacterium]